MTKGAVATIWRMQHLYKRQEVECTLCYAPQSCTAQRWGTCFAGSGAGDLIQRQCVQHGLQCCWPSPSLMCCTTDLCVHYIVFKLDSLVAVLQRFWPPQSAVLTTVSSHMSVLALW